MRRCIGCENVERELDADLLCSWCVGRRDAFNKGLAEGRRLAMLECAEEAERSASEHADQGKSLGLRAGSPGDTYYVARHQEANRMAAWARQKAGE